MYKLTSLFLYYTWECNLRCRHCWVYGGQTSHDKIGVEKSIELCKDAIELGAEFIKLSGGEPLLYYSDIIDVANRVKEIYPDVVFCLETNATLITSDIAKKLKVFDSVSVSLDSAEPNVHNEIRGATDAFSRTITGIKKLRENEIEVSVTSIIHDLDSFEKTDALVEFAEKLAVSRIKFNPVMNIGRAYRENNNFYSITPFQMLELKNRYNRHKGIDVVIMLPCAYNMSILEPNKSKLHSCDCLSLLSVLPNGKVGLCGEAMSINDLCFGDCNTETLKNIWNHSKGLEKLRREIPNNLSGVCADCSIKDVCKGGCRVEGIESGGYLNSPSYICQYMYDKGCFHFGI